MRLPGSTAAGLAGRTIDVLHAAGHQALLVGGCVRDLLLGVEPLDFDIATDATPDRVQQLFPHSEAVGAHFGVIIVKSPDAHVEVATFRSDHAYNDGRHPEVVRFESDPREDVRRRDFTVNALLLDPQSGQIADYVGGRHDLDAKLIRTVGDPEERFREDHLRMLRAVRFAARLDFTIDTNTLAAIGKLASLIHGVSAERIRDEVVRILTEGGARRGFEMLDASGLLPEILPEVSAMKGVAQPPQFHPEGDVWTHTLMMLEGLRNPTLALAMGVLLHDVGKPPTHRIAERIRFDGHPLVGADMTARIMRRLRFSNDDTDQAESLVRDHLRFMHVQDMKSSTLKRFLRQERFEEHLELHRLDCLSSHRKMGNYEFVKAKLEELPREELSPEPLLTGTDLIAAGYTPGPEFKHILNAVESAQLDSLIHNSHQALEFVCGRYSLPSGRPIKESTTPDDT
jgi:poly(A) polymerase